MYHMSVGDEEDEEEAQAGSEPLSRPRRLDLPVHLAEADAQQQQTYVD
jgi:hypothetical protein